MADFVLWALADGYDTLEHFLRRLVSFDVGVESVISLAYGPQIYFTDFDVLVNSLYVFFEL